MVNSANTRDTRVVVPVALRALEAQRLVSLIAYKVSPAVAAGLIAYVHMGELGYALLVTRRDARGAAARRALHAAAWVDAGRAAGARPLRAGARRRRRRGVLALAAGRHMALAELKAPVAGAWLIMGLGAG